MNERLLDAESVGELLHLTPQTVRVYAREGKIRALKVGKRWLFQRPDVEAFLAQQAMRQPALVAEPGQEGL